MPDQLSPINEHRRLDALRSYHILDTLEEQDFDDLTALAATICQVPIALVSLVDQHRQWFKSHHGLSATETPIETSFCAHAIVSTKDIMVVEDAQLDERFKNNPLVTGDPHISFYAGVPLINEDGFPLGTLCVIDRDSRNLTAEQLKALRIIARQVMDKLELRRKNGLLAASEAKAKKFITDAPVAIGILAGRNLVIEQANEMILQVWGKTAAVIGKPLAIGLPELEGQPFLQLLDNVYTSSKAYHGSEAKVWLTRNGIPEECFFNFVYQPNVGADGKTETITVIAYEVTEQIRAGKMVEAKENRFRNMVKSAKVGMTILKGKDLVVETANRPMLAIWGRQEAEVAGKRLLDIFPELYDQPFPQMLADIFKTGESLSIPEITADITDTSGQSRTIFVDFSYEPLFDMEGHVEAVMATVTDITQVVESRKLLEQSQQELTAANEELQAASEEQTATYEQLAMAQAVSELERQRLNQFLIQAPVGVCVLEGPQLTYRFINAGYQALLPGRELQDRPLFEALPELLGTPIEQILLNVYHKGEAVSLHELLIPIAENEGGSLEDRYFTFEYVPWRNVEGSIEGILAFVHDVTEQVLQRQQIKQSEDNLQMLADNMSQLAWMADESGSIFWYNERWYDYTGTTIEEMKGSGWHQVHHPDHVQRVVEKYNTIFASGNIWEDLFPLRGRNGEYRWFLSRAVPLRDEEGRVVRWFGTNTDVTEQKEDERRKNDFISMVSHELKTPLTSLTGYVQMMNFIMTKREDGSLNDILEKSKSQVKKMNAMITGFLDVSRFETGKLYLQQQTFPLDQLIRDTISDIGLTNTTHELIFHGCPEVVLTADPDKIGQVISNLLSNAIKYSPLDTIVEVSCEAKNNCATVSIRDQGMGISQQDQGKLFDRFYRVENKRMETISGFGIGLYLCKEIIERHKGQIWVESETGEGSVFSFRLPLTVAE